MGKVLQRAGGGKVTVEGLAARDLRDGVTVTVKQGNKTVEEVSGSLQAKRIGMFFEVLYEANGLANSGGTYFSATTDGRSGDTIYTGIPGIYTASFDNAQTITYHILTGMTCVYRGGNGYLRRSGTAIVLGDELRAGDTLTTTIFQGDNTFYMFELEEKLGEEG